MKLKRLVGILSLNNFQKIGYIFLLFLLATASSLYAQTNVQIIKANSLKGRTSSEGSIRVLIGDVHIRIDDNHLFCDSALHFVDINEIRAYSRVFIENEEERIWADSAKYNSKTDLSNFFGNILIERDSSLLFSSRVSYSFPLKTAYFTEPLQLEDDKGILKSNRGIYFYEADSASFRGGVQIVDSTLYAEADSLLSNRKSEQYELFGNVFAHESEKQTYLRSQYLYLDSTGHRKLRDQSLLIKVDSAKADTIIIQSRAIDYYEFSDSSYSFSALDSVNIWSKDFSSHSDSANYESITELFTIKSNAFAWNEDLQVSAKSILVQLRDDTVRTIKAFPVPFAVQPDSISGRFQQMRGDSLLATFQHGELQRVLFKPNAAVAFFSNNENDEPDGLMVIHSKSVILFFENGDLVDLKASSDVKATYSEESEGVESYRLTGFIWKPELRPKKQPIPVTNKSIPQKVPLSLYPKHHPLFQK
jgi:lipopolysaccharide export system protein LptA